MLDSFPRSSLLSGEAGQGEGTAWGLDLSPLAHVSIYVQVNYQTSAKHQSNRL